MDLQQTIDRLPRTRSTTIIQLRSLGIQTFQDLLNHFPSRYEDYRRISPIGQAQAGETLTLQGRISQGKYQITRTGMKMERFRLEDESGSISLIWYNQPYLLKLFRSGSLISVSGMIKTFGRDRTMIPSEYELIPDLTVPTLHTGRIVPIYPETRRLSSKTIREKIYPMISGLNLPPLFPPEIVGYNHLLDPNQAYRQIHFPDGQIELKQANRTLAFSELFLLQLRSALIKQQWQKQSLSQPFSLDQSQARSLDQLIAQLPYRLTAAQRRCFQEIKTDLLQPVPMNRLLQGDVGSGKTIVAALAAYLTYLNKKNTLIMAPTTILAQQHYQTILQVFQSTPDPPRIGLYTGAIKTTQHQPRYDILIGTQALLNIRTTRQPSLIVIDEQHRYGVEQRARLKTKGQHPHLLTMTATPIPRTVALTLYGELEMSVIDEMPSGRTPVKTFLVPSEKRTRCYHWIETQLKQTNTQVFIICPLVEESEQETMASVKAATQEYHQLKQRIFPHQRVGLIHGRLKAQEKQRIMNAFSQHELDILVSTAVVEVGIDVPNASIMIIEGAERYGLAQLHQLRGRVGRGTQVSYCFLFSNLLDEKVKKRLTVFKSHHLGLALAEYDLRQRGAGTVFGKRQHGHADLKIASFSDYDLIDSSQRAVRYLLDHYSAQSLPQTLVAALPPLSTNALIGQD